MESVTRVEFRTLRETINAIFDFIENDLRLESVELPENFYWTVPDDVLFDMSAPPSQLDVGSLVDDLESVRSAHADRARAFPLMFWHVAPLLYVLKDAVPSYVSPPPP